MIIHIVEGKDKKTEVIVDDGIYIYNWIKFEIVLNGMWCIVLRDLMMSDYKFNQPKSVIQSRNKLKFIKKCINYEIELSYGLSYNI